MSVSKHAIVQKTVNPADLLTEEAKNKAFTSVNASDRHIETDDLVLWEKGPNTEAEYKEDVNADLKATVAELEEEKGTLLTWNTFLRSVCSYQEEVARANGHDRTVMFREDGADQKTPAAMEGVKEDNGGEDAASEDGAAPAKDLGPDASDRGLTPEQAAEKAALESILGKKIEELGLEDIFRRSCAIEGFPTTVHGAVMMCDAVQHDKFVKQMACSLLHPTPIKPSTLLQFLVPDLQSAGLVDSFFAISIMHTAFLVIFSNVQGDALDRASGSQESTKNTDRKVTSTKRAVLARGNKLIENVDNELTVLHREHVSIIKNYTANHPTLGRFIHINRDMTARFIRIIEMSILSLVDIPTELIQIMLTTPIAGGCSETEHRTVMEQVMESMKALQDVRSEITTVDVGDLPDDDCDQPEVVCTYYITNHLKHINSLLDSGSMSTDEAPVGVSKGVKSRAARGKGKGKGKGK
jgi:hypothetical protein